MSKRDTMIGFLSVAVLEVRFKKVNGDDRVMLCTLDPTRIPEQTDEEKTKTTKKNDSVLAVWDVEKEGWRSFKVDNVYSTRKV